MRRYEVQETFRDVTKEPEGQYNRVVIEYQNKRYEVVGTPFCFAGSSDGDIKERATSAVSWYLDTRD